MYLLRKQWVDVQKNYNLMILKGRMTSIAGLKRLYDRLHLEYENFK